MRVGMLSKEGEFLPGGAGKSRCMYRHGSDLLLTLSGQVERYSEEISEGKSVPVQGALHIGTINAM